MLRWRDERRNLQCEDTTHHDLGVTHLPVSGGNDSPSVMQSIYRADISCLYINIYKFYINIYHVPDLLFHLVTLA